MKKKLLLGLAGAVAVAAIAGGAFYYQNQLDLKLNDETIESDEYLYVMNSQIYEVTQELATKNGKQVDKDFWTEEINGVIPYEVLADKTIEQLKYNRAIYENAREQGYVDEVDYKHILERMEAENKSRAEKIAAGEAVYGLSEFSEQLFIEYETDTFQKRYCENLENEGMEITEEEREEYYEENKDTVYVKEDDLTIDYIKIDYVSEGLDETAAKEIKDKLISLYKKSGEGESLEQLAKGDADFSGYFEHEEILSGEMSMKAREIGDIIEYAYELQKGDMTQVIDENGALYLIQCVDRVEHDYLPLEDVKDHINKTLRERHYNELIERRAADTKVDGDMDRIYAFTKRHINK